MYFVTQNPLDVPDIVLGQLGNRVQHALRAFTPRDQKAVRAAAETFRSNPELDVAQVITELGVGEALVSFLDEKGRPGIVERALIYPPYSQIGPIAPDQRHHLIRTSLVYGIYESVVDRESAYELLKGRAEQSLQEAEEKARHAVEVKEQELLRKEQDKEAQRLTRERQKEQARVERERQKEAERQQRERAKIAESFAKSAARGVGSTFGRQVVRGILGVFGIKSGR